MRVWLINTGETLPTDPGLVRLWRMGILADILVARGHEVVWWASTFRHSHKNQRFPRDTVVEFADRYRIRYLHVPPYRRNVSLSRLWNHHLLGRKFRRLSAGEPRPDLIFCSYPILELSDESVRYGRQAGVPVILDIRDLWPDMFLDVAPRWARGACRLALEPLFRKARRTLRGAFAISGNSPAFVEWGLRYANRRRTPYDRDFPFGYAVEAIDPAAAAEAGRFWQRQGVPAQPGADIVCFIGLLNAQFDVDAVIRAARLLGPASGVQFVLCGTGVRLDTYRKAAADCPHVVFPGWVNAPEIRALLDMSRLALTPYLDRVNYQGNITNKVIEYLSGGLPILTSLPRGTVLDLLRQHDCGQCYDGDQQLAETIRSLLAAPERLQEMSRNARRLFSDRFTATAVYAEMADHLEKVGSAFKELEVRS